MLIYRQVEIFNIIIKMKFSPSDSAASGNDLVVIVYIRQVIE